MVIKEEGLCMGHVPSHSTKICDDKANKVTVMAYRIFAISCQLITGRENPPKTKKALISLKKSMPVFSTPDR